jgi:hypothetical protein
LNYAKKHPIQKRPRKDIINGRTNAVDCDDPPLEELGVCKLGNNDDILSCNFICFNSTLVLRKAKYEKAKAQWEKSNRVALMIMNNTTNPAIKGALSKNPENAKDFYGQN